MCLRYTFVIILNVLNSRFGSGKPTTKNENSVVLKAFGNSLRTEPKE